MLNKKTCFPETIWLFCHDWFFGELLNGPAKRTLLPAEPGMAWVSIPFAAPAGSPESARAPLSSPAQGPKENLALQHRSGQRDSTSLVLRTILLLMQPTFTLAFFESSFFRCSGLKHSTFAPRCFCLCTLPRPRLVQLCSNPYLGC